MFLVFWLIDIPYLGRCRTLYIICFTYSFLFLLSSSFSSTEGIVFLLDRIATGFTTLLIYGCRALLYVYSLESYPTHLRSTGLGINIIMGSIGNVVSFLLKSSIGNYVTYVDVLISVASGVLACYLKETRIDEEVHTKEEDNKNNKISMPLMPLIGDNNND